MTDPKQIPFDWDEYEKTGRPVFTRGGDEVTQLIRFEKVKHDYCIVGVTEGATRSWTRQGKFSSMSEPHDLDLVFHPRTETRSIWVNVYPSSVDDHPHKSKHAAELCASSDRIDCIELTYEVEVP